MVVILDTDLLPQRHRANAVNEAMQQSGIPARVTHEPPPERVYARINCGSSAAAPHSCTAMVPASV